MDLITEHLDVWTTAQVQKASGRGKRTNNQSIYGTKKLRVLILELAVRGKLVEQDPVDEPADVLLKKIATERSQLVKEKAIYKPKVLPKISAIEAPSSVPQGWQNTRLGIVGYWAIGSGFPKKEQGIEGEAILFSKVSDMNLPGNEKFIISTLNSVSEATANKLRFKIHPTGTVVFPKIGGAIATNKRRIIVKPTIIDNNCLGIRPSVGISTNYLYLYLLSLDLTRYQAGTSVPALSQGVLELIVLGLPPLAEQIRIVAKVDELMALCEQLEQQQTNSNATHQTLVKTLLATLTHPTTGADGTEPNTIEIFFQHFDTLFTTEQSIDQLKQTILQLAVMGKLVPQDSTDEPASTLLQRIAIEKNRLITTGKLKKQKPIPKIVDNAKLFVLPKGWAWGQLDSLSFLSEAGWSPRCLPTARKNHEWGVLKVSAVTWGVFNPSENKELPPSLKPRPRYEVKPGDFLISRANTAELVARAVVVPDGTPMKLMLSDKIIRFVLSKEVSAEFIKHANNSEYSRAYYSSVAGGTSSSMRNVTREQIRKLVIGVPPLHEQHRIVAKVNKLMALCDDLKAQLSDARTTQFKLANTIGNQAAA